MALSHDRRYQVFVSSTYEDLRHERQAVMQALLELGCLPAGMELFPAANEQQWNLIKREIDSCDYYIVILGGRYGSLGPDGIGYTEMEYRYAVKLGKPTVAFLHKSPDSLPARKTERTDDGRKKYDLFRTLLRSRLCKQWASPMELSKAVAMSVIELINSFPATGWIRGDSASMPRRLLSLSECAQEIMSLARSAEPGDELAIRHLGLDMSSASDYVGALLRACRAGTIEYKLLIMSDQIVNLAPEAPDEVKAWATYMPGSLARIRKHIGGKPSLWQGINLRVEVRKYAAIPVFHGIIIDQPKRLSYLSICHFSGQSYESYDWGEFNYHRIERSRKVPADENLADILDSSFMSLWNSGVQEWLFP